MPKALEDKLKKEASTKAKEGKLHPKKGESMKQAMAAYVYGTLRKTGWKPGQK